MRVNPTAILSELGVFDWSSKTSSELIDYLLRSRAPYNQAVTTNPSLYFAHLKLGPGMKILDAGCGIGFQSEALYSYSLKLAYPFKVYACDNNRDFINYIRFKSLSTATSTTSGSGVDYRVASLEALPYNNNMFDRIVVSYVLQHIKPDRLFGIMLELLRVCKYDGIITIEDTDWTSFKHIVEPIDNYDELMEAIAKVTPSYDVVNPKSFSNRFNIKIQSKRAMEYHSYDEQLVFNDFRLTRRRYTIRKIIPDTEK
jgi:ubiquinone/menaquinone biosynthesis C-methylase UbiE